MEIRRGGQQPHEQFAMVPNGSVRDVRLSFRARGILAFLLSHRDGWKVTTERVAGEGKEGRDAVRTAFTELEHAGYMRRSRERAADGTFINVMVLYPYGDAPADSQQAGSADFQASGSPAPGNPAPDFQASIRRPSKNTNPYSPHEEGSTSVGAHQDDGYLGLESHQGSTSQLETPTVRPFPMFAKSLLVGRWKVTDERAWIAAWTMADGTYQTSRVEHDLAPEEHLGTYLTGCQETGYQPRAQRWLQWWQRDRIAHLTALRAKEEAAAKAVETAQEREDRQNAWAPPLDWGLPIERGDSPVNEQEQMIDTPRSEQ